MELENYNEAVSTIKQAILQSQYRAAKLVTGEQLSLYFRALSPEEKRKLEEFRDAGEKKNREKGSGSSAA